MDALWKMGKASIREMQEQLPEKRRPAYTTVQTMVNRLEEKGAVRRVRKIGNAHIYEPSVSRKAAYRRLIDDFLDLFGGSAQPVIGPFPGSRQAHAKRHPGLGEYLQDSTGPATGEFQGNIAMKGQAEIRGC